jgi:hypothetical protein
MGLGRTLTPEEIQHKLQEVRSSAEVRSQVGEAYAVPPPPEKVLDGSTAHYYELPIEVNEFQDVVAYINCNAQMGEIGRAWMRYGRCPHSPRRRDLKKIIFYAQQELARLDKYEPEES